MAGADARHPGTGRVRACRPSPPFHAFICPRIGIVSGSRNTATRSHAFSRVIQLPLDLAEHALEGAGIFGGEAETADPAA